MLCSTIFKMYSILVFASTVVCTPTYSEEYIKGSYENWVPIPNDLYFTTLAFNDYPQYSTETTNNKNLWTPVNNDFISGTIDTGNVIQVVKHDLINKTDETIYEKTPQPAEVHLLHEAQKAEQYKNIISTQNLKNISSVNNSSIPINNTNELGHFVMKLKNMRPSRKPKDIQYKHTNINHYGSTISHNDREESLIKQNKIPKINPREEENTSIGVEEIHDNKASSTQSVGVKHNNRFINNLNSILSAYNIYNDDIGRNYRISRQYIKEIPKKVNAEHYVDGTDTQIPIPHQQHLIYNNWNNLPVDPLFAVLLSRYGVRLNVGSKKLGYFAHTYTIPN